MHSSVLWIQVRFFLAIFYLNRLLNFIIRQSLWATSSLLSQLFKIHVLVFFFNHWKLLIITIIDSFIRTWDHLTMHRHIFLKPLLHSFSNLFRSLQSFDQFFIQILFSLNINCWDWFFYGHWAFWCKLVDLRHTWNAHRKFNCLNCINFYCTFEKVDLAFKFIGFFLNLTAFKYVASFK